METAAMDMLLTPRPGGGVAKFHKTGDFKVDNKYLSPADILTPGTGEYMFHETADNLLAHMFASSSTLGNFIRPLTEMNSVTFRRLQWLLLQELYKSHYGKYIISGGFSAFCCGKTEDYSDLDIYMQFSNFRYHMPEFVNHFAGALHNLVRKAFRQIADDAEITIEHSVNLKYPLDVYVFKVMIIIADKVRGQYKLADFCLTNSFSFGRRDHGMITRYGRYWQPKPVLFKNRDPLNYMIKKLYAETPTESLKELIREYIVMRYDLDICKSVSLPLSPRKGYMISWDVSNKSPKDQVEQMHTVSTNEERKRKYKERLSGEYYYLDSAIMKFWLEGE